MTDYSPAVLAGVEALRDKIDEESDEVTVIGIFNAAMGDWDSIGFVLFTLDKEVSGTEGAFLWRDTTEDDRAHWRMIADGLRMAFTVVLPE